MKPNKTDSILSFNDLKWVFSAIVRYWYLFVIFITISSVFGTLYNHKQVSKYHTKIEILLKSNDVYDYQENLYSNLGFYNYYGDIANQIRIINSYDIIQKVLDRLDLQCSYYIVGRLNTKEFFDGLPFKIDVKIFNPKIYETPIAFKIINNKQYELKLSINGEESIQVHSFDSLETNVHYSINTKLLNYANDEESSQLSSINYQVVFHQDQFWVNKILANLSVENIEYTSLLTVNLLDEIPSRSKMILDTLAIEYINYTLENQFYINENTLTYINYQLDDVVTVIDSIGYDLQNMRDKKGILDVDKESEKYFQSLMIHEANKRELIL